jgi:hypothetical protein
VVCVVGRLGWVCWPYLKQISEQISVGCCFLQDVLVRPANNCVLCSTYMPDRLVRQHCSTHVSSHSTCISAACRECRIRMRLSLCTGLTPGWAGWLYICMPGIVLCTLRMACYVTHVCSCCESAQQHSAQLAGVVVKRMSCSCLDSRRSVCFGLLSGLDINGRNPTVDDRRVAHCAPCTRVAQGLCKAAH